MIFAGDVGGTKTNLGHFEVTGSKLVCVAEESFASGAYRGLDEIIALFTAKEKQTATSACFGVAGPVRDGRCKVVNLPWTVDAGDIALQLGTKDIRVINDLEATAYAINVLPPDKLVELNQDATFHEGNRAVIAAGTGLGEAGLYWDGRRHHPFASEGGHADFSPRSKIELSLADYLIEMYGHSSWERVLSGPGLVNVYQFLSRKNPGRSNADVSGRIERHGAIAISQAAGNKECDICEQSLNLFASLYGAEAGNLALKMYAVGGIYIGGGIAPKIIERLRAPGFRDAFVSKGRLRPLLESIPVSVITTNRAALIGAAECARSAYFDVSMEMQSIPVVGSVGFRDFGSANHRCL